MPKKADPVAVLSEEVLRVLESQRNQGGGAYPQTLRRLAELCGRTPAQEHIFKAVGKKAFTSKAVVTEKVDGKPSLDSPVYFKGDVPKKDPVAELAKWMLLVLEAQRRLGGEAYPPTLRRLAELCDRLGSDTLILKAAEHKVMAERIVVIAKDRGKPSREAPVVLKEDVEHRASAVLPALLRFALRPVTTTVKKKKVETYAFTPDELKKRFVPDLQKPVGDAVERGLERQDLPPDVAWEWSPSGHGIARPVDRPPRSTSENEATPIDPPAAWSCPRRGWSTRGSGEAPLPYSVVSGRLSYRRCCPGQRRPRFRLLPRATPIR